MPQLFTKRCELAMRLKLSTVLGLTAVVGLAGCLDLSETPISGVTADF